jgi:hypothetical protein
MISVIFGGKGESDPVAVARFSDITTKALSSYITQPDDQFRSAAFTRHPTTNKPGTLQILKDHARVITARLSPAQKAEVTTATAAAAGNSLRVLGGALRSKYPTLRDKIQISMDFPGGNSFVLKPGVKPESLTAVERQGLAAFNMAANGPLMLEVLQTYGGVDRAGAAQLVKDNYQPGQVLRASESPSKARPETGSRGSSGVNQQGATKRWWDQ